jgi:hypothetical protein
MPISCGEHTSSAPGKEGTHIAHRVHEDHPQLCANKRAPPHEAPCPVGSVSSDTHSTQHTQHTQHSNKYRPWGTRCNKHATHQRRLKVLRVRGDDALGPHTHRDVVKQRLRKLLLHQTNRSGNRTHHRQATHERVAHPAAKGARLNIHGQRKRKLAFTATGVVGGGGPHPLRRGIQPKPVARSHEGTPPPPGVNTGLHAPPPPDAHAPSTQRGSARTPSRAAHPPP